MSIVIHNISPVYSRQGIQLYEVKLNHIPLTTFTHHAEDGMVKCLMLASEALSKIDIDKVIKDWHIRYIDRLLEIGEI